MDHPTHPLEGAGHGGEVRQRMKLSLTGEAEARPGIERELRNLPDQLDPGDTGAAGSVELLVQDLG
jgi:hypothetical protein